MDAAEFRAFSLPLDTVDRFCRQHELGRATGLERVRKGEVSATFRVGLEGGETAILKVYCRSNDPQWLIREHASFEYLRRHGDAPVPGWSRLDISQDIIPFPCLLGAHMPGVDGDEALGPSAPRVRLARLMRRCGAALAALHRTPLDAVDELHEGGIYSADRWAGRTVAQFEQTIRSLRDQGWIDVSLLNEAERTFNRQIDALNAPFEPVFCHRDYQLWNLRVDPDSLDILALLDFDSAGLGPAESDVRDLELNEFLARPWLRREFWTGYGRPIPAGLAGDRLRLSALVRALSLLAAYWGPTDRVTPASVWLLLSPWAEEIEDYDAG